MTKSWKIGRGPKEVQRMETDDELCNPGEQRLLSCGQMHIRVQFVYS